MRIGIVGAGIMGRSLAWQLTRQGYTISLFDKDDIDTQRTQQLAAAYTAAGMLTPFSEAESAEAIIVELGQHALEIWPQWNQQLNNAIDFNQKGSLVVSHPNDRADLMHFRQHVSRLSATQNALTTLTRAQVSELEPDLGDRFHDASYIPNEAWLNPSLCMAEQTRQLIEANVPLYSHCHFEHVSGRHITANNHNYEFDLVIDCRGLGAKPDMPNLRGVRGEVITLHAPEVNIQRLVRFMHPRYRLYLVPRANHHYVLGATQIESDHQGPITVRSTMELLSAAYAINPAFGEASIINTRVNCRPALANNHPQIQIEDQLLRVNGLFRHGILLTPVMVTAVTEYLKNKAVPEQFQSLFLDKTISA